MDPRTRRQLLDINQAFYEAHAEAFDRSRGARPWPGWQRLVPLLPADPADGAGRRPLGAVLDVGCGNARFACFLDQAGFAFRYTGVDANPALLAAARRQLPEALAGSAELVLHDFLASGAPGEALPPGPFELVVLMGVLHHVPGADWRLALLRAAAARLASRGRLVLAVWQFEDDPREQRKRVDWPAAATGGGAAIDPAALEPGDALLRFGDDPGAPPRYCHSVRDAEFEAWPAALGLACAGDFRADGARGIANRYAVLRRA
ncbi:MAG: class I SAM-dependent methyltransferase [Myxococcota bacterium]